MHSWTAPGSVRGAVDFIPLGGSYYNVADFFIVGSTGLFVLSVGYLLGRMTYRLAPMSPAEAYSFSGSRATSDTGPI
jgi:hypothetical protein